MPRKPLDEAAIRRRVKQAGQGHVFRFWNKLTKDARSRLLADLAEVNFKELQALIRKHIVKQRPVELPPDLEPAPFIPLPETRADRALRRHMHRLGGELIAAGRVAALVVAGGQGTRLGFDGPKGAFPIGPASGRPLFQIFAEAILAARRAYRASIPWYVMTSRDNDHRTREFFREHGCFGLPPDDVKFFSQASMPAVDLHQRRLILAARDQLAWSPDGHGGTIRALARSGMLADMAARGIECISYFQVDNPLVPPVDPVFLGFHADARSDMSSKMAVKRDPGEEVGIFCVSRGQLHVVEYSDLKGCPDILDARGPDRALRFAAGSIAIHILDRRFVERLAARGRSALPFHRAEKKVEYVDKSGRHRKPRTKNAVKFEMFIFDALPAARRPVVLQIDRAAEFSPVKNADGEDTPATARRDMLLLAARRLREAGVRVPQGPGGLPLHKVEISPLAARTAEELRALARRLGLKKVTRDLYLGPETG